MKHLAIVAFLVAFYCSNAFSQECPKGLIVITDSLGTHNDKLAIPLDFRLRDDSVLIYYNYATRKQFLGFAVLGSVCKWQKEEQMGFIKYELLLKDENKEERPVMEILYGDKVKTVRLLYPDSEERIFTIRAVNRSD